MKKKFNKYAIIIITILLAELINVYALSFLVRYKSEAHPYRSVVITMLATVLIFYPALIFINSYLKKASGKYMSKTSRLAGGSIFGRAAGFFLALVLIYMAFCQALYNKNLIADLKVWIGGML